MNKTKLRIPALLMLAGAMALGGCGDSTSDPPPVPKESATPSVAADQDCELAEISGQSKNSELQALATVQYEALDCADDLGAQLQTLGNDPTLQQQVEAAGWDLTTDEAAGGVTLNIVDVDARTSCLITVMDSLKAKSMVCGDL